MSPEQTLAGKLMSPSALCQVILRLCEILETENDLLDQNKPESFSESLSEKTRLVAIYNQQMTLIKQDPGKYKAFPKPDVDKLKQASEAFYEILDNHFRKLSTVKTVTEGIVKSVADEVAKKKAPPSTYTAAAGMAAPRPNAKIQPANAAIAINQVV